MAYKKNNNKKKSEEAKSDETLDILMGGLENAMGHFIEVMKIQSLFPNHSLNNTLLEWIQAQSRADKGVTFRWMFKGKESWTKLGRTLIEGEEENAIKIYSPNIVKISNKEKLDLDTLKEKDEVYIKGHAFKKIFANGEYGIFALRVESINGEEMSGYLNIAGNIAKNITLNKSFSVRGIVTKYKGFKQLSVSSTDDVNEITLVDSYTKKVLTGFSLVSVYDYSQSEGEEIPNLSICNKITAEDDISKDVIAALDSMVDIPVNKEATDCKGNGYFVTTEGEERIAIKKGLGINHQCKTFAHEYMHYTLHKEKKAKKFDLSKFTTAKVGEYAVEEIIVESVAFIVLNHFGIDVEDYSFEYVLSWSSADLSIIKKVSAIIQKHSNELISEIKEVMGVGENRDIDVEVEVA
jgi:hypothetical protein